MIYSFDFLWIYWFFKIYEYVFNFFSFLKKKNYFKKLTRRILKFNFFYCKKFNGKFNLLWKIDEFFLYKNETFYQLFFYVLKFFLENDIFENVGKFKSFENSQRICFMGRLRILSESIIFEKFREVVEKIFENLNFLKIKKKRIQKN